MRLIAPRDHGESPVVATSTEGGYHGGLALGLQAFAARQMAMTGGTQYVRVGGKGAAVLLLHGFGDTGDMWVPLADALVKDHAVIVPDLRGMGLSSHPEAGYEKVAQARDLAAILDQLGFQTSPSSPTTSATWWATRLWRCSGARDPMGGDGRAFAGHRPLGRPVEESEDLAFQLSRA